MPEESDSKLEGMREMNRKQAEFYDTGSRTRGNVLTRTWNMTRKRFISLRKDAGVIAYTDDLLYSWLGDLSDKNVLELGSGPGRGLSLRVARASKSYLAIDLSEVAIEELRRKLVNENISHARAEALDFLAPTFTENFDVIYAPSVMHHFQYFDSFLSVLDSHLNPGGVIVSLDPMQTDRLITTLRRLYRPFQTDKEWEWPFTQETFKTIQEHFTISKVQGIFGYSKYAIPIVMIAPERGLKIMKRLHQRDVEKANRLGGDLWRCITVAMQLHKRT